MYDRGIMIYLKNIGRYLEIFLKKFNHVVDLGLILVGIVCFMTSCNRKSLDFRPSIDIKNLFLNTNLTQEESCDIHDIDNFLFFITSCDYMNGISVDTFPSGNIIVSTLLRTINSQTESKSYFVKIAIVPIDGHYSNTSVIKYNTVHSNQGIVLNSRINNRMMYCNKSWIELVDLSFCDRSMEAKANKFRLIIGVQ